MINNESNPENIRTVARRAHHDRNTDLAKYYFNKLLIVDPSSWEAYFYTLYYDIMTCRTGKIAEKCENMISGMETALQMMFDSVTDPTQRRNNMHQIAVDFMVLEDNLTEKIFDEYERSKNADYTDYIVYYSAVAICAGEYCAVMYKVFGNAEVPLYYDCWCKTVDMFSTAIKNLKKKYGAFVTLNVIRTMKNVARKHIENIRKYNPSYVKPKYL